MAEYSNKFVLQDSVSSSLKTIGKNFDTLGSKVEHVKGILESGIGFGIGIQLIQGIEDFVSEIPKAVDELTTTYAKLNMINDGLQTTTQLQDKVFQIANQSRTAYGQIADMVTGIGQQTKGLFATNDQLLTFSKAIAETFALNPGQNVQSAMYELTHGMEQGVLTMREFRGLMSDSPALVNMMGQALGKNRTELLKMASSGQLTADVIKNAFLSASDLVQDKLNQIPQTFQSTMIIAQNNILKAFRPVASEIDSLLNSRTFLTTVSFIINGITRIFNTVSMLFTWAFAHKDLIIGAFIGIGIAILYFVIPAVVSLVIAAFPVVAVIGLIIGVGILLAELFEKFPIVAEIAFGAISAGITFIQNMFIGLWNFLIGFANFFGNLFNNPIGAIENLFARLTKSVLGFLGFIAKGIDALFKTNLTSAIDNVNKSITLAPEKTFFKTVQYGDIGKSFQSGAKIGADFSKWLTNLSTSTNNLLKKPSMPAVAGIPATTGMGIDTTKGTKSNPVVTKDVNSEDLKRLRELTEKRAIVQITQQSPVINLHVTGDTMEDKTNFMIAKLTKTLTDLNNKGGAKPVAT